MEGRAVQLVREVGAMVAEALVVVDLVEAAVVVEARVEGELGVACRAVLMVVAVGHGGQQKVSAVACMGEVNVAPGMPVLAAGVGGEMAAAVEVAGVMVVVEMASAATVVEQLEVEVMVEVAVLLEASLALLLAPMEETRAH